MRHKAIRRNPAAGVRTAPVATQAKIGNDASNHLRLRLIQNTCLIDTGVPMLASFLPRYGMSDSGHPSLSLPPVVALLAHSPPVRGSSHGRIADTSRRLARVDGRLHQPSWLSSYRIVLPRWSLLVVPLKYSHLSPSRARGTGPAHRCLPFMTCGVDGDFRGTRTHGGTNPTRLLSRIHQFPYL